MSQCTAIVALGVPRPSGFGRQTHLLARDGAVVRIESVTSAVELAPFIEELDDLRTALFDLIDKKFDAIADAYARRVESMKIRVNGVWELRECYIDMDFSGRLRRMPVLGSGELLIDPLGQDPFIVLRPREPLLPIDRPLGDCLCLMSVCTYPRCDSGKKRSERWKD